MAKRNRVYKGLGRRPFDTSLIPFESIRNYLDTEYFVLDKSDNHITVARTTKLMCNGNKVFLETKIWKDGSFNIYVGNTTVSVCAKNKIAFTKTEIQAFFTTMKSVKLCTGVEASKVASSKKENVIQQFNSENLPVAYSMQCSKILKINLQNSGTTCRSCLNLKTNRKSVTKSALTHPPPSLEPPSSSVPPPSLDPPSRSPLSSIDNNVPDQLRSKNSNPDLKKKSPESIMSFLKENAPYLSSGQMTLIESQLKNSSVDDAHARQWDPEIIQLSLSMWTRSPRTYEHLSNSGNLILPSAVTLSRYKNSVQQKTGINNDMLKWMYMEALHEHLPDTGYYGGLILDEMSIQPDLQIVRRAGNSHMLGLVDLGKEADGIKSGQRSLANHVIQFMFHGITGFRFLVAHYPTNQANGPQIYSIFWDVVQALESWGFHIIYTCLDGASNNRTFINIHFPSPSTDMSIINPFSTLCPLVFLADPSHLIKKIRNNILSSGCEKWHTRLLEVNGHEITWRTFIAAYEWDKNHGLSIHQKLTNQHLRPNTAEKMRNFLAEECLDEDMLHLIRRFQESCTNSSQAAKCKGPIILLEQTSRLVKIFKDRRPIFHTTDSRLKELESILSFFSKWETDQLDTKKLMSRETREDIRFLLLGFKSLVATVIQKINHYVTPLYINSDIIENNFSQQRGLHHGASTNPNYVQYSHATNAITLCQNIISKKANTAKRKSERPQGSALPFKQLCKELNL